MFNVERLVAVDISVFACRSVRVHVNELLGFISHVMFEVLDLRVCHWFLLW